MEELNQSDVSGQVNRNYNLLMEACNYIATPGQRAMIRKAFHEITDIFQDQLSENGSPTFDHAVSVARIVAEEMELDATCIVAALLHDMQVQEPEIAQSIEYKYSKKVLDIVTNLHRVSELRMDKVSINSENFIQLMLTISVDFRVILIRLADRLNIMRMIDLLPHDRQQQISLETSGLYSPLAHRLGLYKIKTELEELAMQHAYPEVFASISRKIEESRDEQSRYFKKFIGPIEKELFAQGFSYEIKFRTKSIPSIWNKMRKQNIDFEQVYDFFAIRIILNSSVEHEKADCWKAYSLVTNIYQPNPSRLRDWVSAPKANGYESLHTTVMGPRGKFIEVQIRSKRMDEAAEKGRAAHWKYKEVPANAIEAADKWLANIRSILENYTPGEEEVGTSRMELFSDYIYAFTPQGDLKKLKAGATVLDFAFEVHTEVGQKCTGAKVNNLYVPLKHVLRTGDQVEVTTSKNQKPSTDWLSFATSSKAISKIKRCLKDAEFSQADRGRELFLKKLVQLKQNYSEELSNKLVSAYKSTSILDFYHGIAEGKYDLQKLKEILNSFQKTEDVKVLEKPFTKAVENKTKQYSSKTLVVINESTPLDDVKLARCCQPVFGDEIFGFVTVAEGIKIHRTSCTNALEMHTRYAYRIVTARWAEKSEISAYIATLVITGDDQQGILNRISDTITHDLNANIRSINLASANGKFEGTISVNVDGKSHLDLIIARLSKLKGIKRVMREK
jgi:GTP diphosphokinase / guanosine-3',5'-bis(diphosphate) 3'-diphosphatase